MNKTKVDLKKLVREKSNKLIELDGRIILSIIVATNNGVVMSNLLPYMALYCRSAQEFFGNTIISDKYDKQINDIRNGLKIFSERYNRGRKAVLAVDQQQDGMFAKMLRFNFMRNWNIHLNLGVYFDDAGHIVGNTQNMSYFFNIKSDEIKNMNMHAFKIGKVLGENIYDVLEQVSSMEGIFDENNIKCPKIGYMDFNTNKDGKFFNNNYDKGLNLTFLHILSMVGFVEHVLYFMLPKDNMWLLRIEYICAHYAWQGLRKIKQHFDGNGINDTFIKKIEELLKNGVELFESEFRNCMMHYDLCNKNGQIIVLEKYYSDNNVFFGLVESCFNGLSYEEFFNKIRKYLYEIEEILMKLFYVEKEKIKWDS